MRKMNWYKSESDTRPELVDETSSRDVTYIRKNIREEVREDMGEERTVYTYDECKLSKDAYMLYQQNETNAANIDYIAMMTGVEI